MHSLGQNGEVVATGWRTIIWKIGRH